jgi:hypothetical protein
VRWFINLVAILWLATLASMSFDCGHVKKPLPTPPPGGVPCSIACTHAYEVCSLINESICMPLCDSEQQNRPEYSACLLEASGCADVDDCDR